ncbi:MAG: hypothetical protein ACI8TX_001021 [Hyphomicrobiaceae bacterium]|jgi:uncharacterized protein (TIRG00374 family)
MKGGSVAGKVVISLLIGGVCLALALNKVDGGEIAAALKSFDLRWLAVAVGLSFLIQILRALRWKLELSPLTHVSFATTWQVVAVAYMMINVLPFRLGEPVRPVLMSMKSGLTIPAILANWVFEKTVDSAVLLLFIQITLVVADLPDWAHGASKFALISFISLLVFIVAFWLKGEQFFERTLGRVLHGHARERAHKILINAREGLQILPDRRLVFAVFAISLVYWFIPILSSYALIRGFGFDLPFAAAFVVFVCIGLGTALPNPPGMIGVFQIAAVVALGLYGVEKSQAVAYGIMLNAVQFVTLVLQGLIALPFVGVDLKRLTKAAVVTETCEEPNLNGPSA